MNAFLAIILLILLTACVLDLALALLNIPARPRVENDQ
jgi:hypothetical protein